MTPSFDKTYNNLLLEKFNILNTIQNALDVAGLEPTVGTFADGANSVISLLRAAAAKEPDQRKKHMINAGISSISMVPFGDVAKLLKFRKVPKTAVKGFIKGSRGIKNYAKVQKKYGDRFNDE